MLWGRWMLPEGLLLTRKGNGSCHFRVILISTPNWEAVDLVYLDSSSLIKKKSLQSEVLWNWKGSQEPNCWNWQRQRQRNKPGSAGSTRIPGFPLSHPHPQEISGCLCSAEFFSKEIILVVLFLLYHQFSSSSSYSRCFASLLSRASSISFSSFLLPKSPYQLLDLRCLPRSDFGSKYFRIPSWSKVTLLC